MLDWPDELGERTPPEERDHGSKFDVGFNRTQKDIQRELERMDVDMWGADHDTGSSRDDPGYVVRWTKDGQDFAIACDGYTSKKANARACYLWLNETRMRSDRPVRHGGSQFAAAALPPGDEEAVKAARRPPAHEVLSLSRDADPDIVKAAAKRLKKRYHPDSGEDPDEEQFKLVNWAEEVMLGD